MMLKNLNHIVWEISPSFPHYVMKIYPLLDSCEMKIRIIHMCQEMLRHLAIWLPLLFRTSTPTPSELFTQKNHCDMNCVIQLLFSILRTISHNFQFNSSTEGSISKFLFEIAHSVSSSTDVDALKVRLVQYDKFNGGEKQEDASECLMMLIKLIKKGSVPYCCSNDNNSTGVSLSEILFSFMLEKYIYLRCMWTERDQPDVPQALGSPVSMFSTLWYQSLCSPCSPVPMFPRNVSQFRCSPTLHYPVPVFPNPYVPQSLCSPPYDISPYVPHVPQTLCYPEMFPSPVAPQPYITQSLCSPVPMFPSPYVPQSLCSPVHLFPSPYRCSPVPMLPSPYVPPTNSPVPMFRTLIPQKLLFPIFPKHVPQSLCSPNYFTSSCVPHSVSSLLQPPKYWIVFVNWFRYINNNFTKDRYSIPMDMTVVLGLHKFSLQLTINHHGRSMYSGHYTVSINCCKRKFYCNDSKITEFEIIDTKNCSTAYVVMYKLIT